MSHYQVCAYGASNRARACGASPNAGLAPAAHRPIGAIAGGSRAGALPPRPRKFLAVAGARGAPVPVARSAALRGHHRYCRQIARPAGGRRCVGAPTAGRCVAAPGALRPPPQAAGPFAARLPRSALWLRPIGAGWRPARSARAGARPGSGGGV